MAQLSADLRAAANIEVLADNLLEKGAGYDRLIEALGERKLPTGWTFGIDRAAETDAASGITQNAAGELEN